MIINFSVENFLSIKEKLTVDMKASYDLEFSENLIPFTRNRYLKSVPIFGTNGSGKSNLLKAINMVVVMLQNSNNMQPGQKLPIIPFKLDSEYANKPSSFEIKMVIDNIKYLYGFVADQNKIYEEYLYYYPNGKETEIFERKETNNYHFTTMEHTLLKDLVTKNIENKFFLATATTWNYEKTKPVYDFLTNGIKVLLDNEQLKSFAFSEYMKDTTGELKNFALKMLKTADTTLSDFNVSEVELPNTQLFGMPQEFRSFFPNETKSYNVTTSHEITNAKGKAEKVDFNFEEEAMGTQNLFILCPLLFNVLKEGKMLFIDELDKSLHSFLVKYIVQTFHSEEYNKNGAQLIFNTHDTNMLDLTIFRRDQIFFMEKEKGGTRLYALGDFPVRTTTNIQKRYLEGRYRALPLIEK